jgi:hypothetical protein
VNVAGLPNLTAGLAPGMPALLPDSGLECETSADQGSAGAGDFPGEFTELMLAGPAELILISAPLVLRSLAEEIPTFAGGARPKGGWPDPEAIVREAAEPAERWFFPEAGRDLPAPAVGPGVGASTHTGEASSIGTTTAEPEAEMASEAEIPRKPPQGWRFVEPGRANSREKAGSEERSLTGTPPAAEASLGARGEADAAPRRAFATRLPQPAVREVPAPVARESVAAFEPWRPEVRLAVPGEKTEIAFAAKITQEPLVKGLVRAALAPAAGGGEKPDGGCPVSETEPARAGVAASRAPAPPAGGEGIDGNQPESARPAGASRDEEAGTSRAPGTARAGQGEKSPADTAATFGTAPPTGVAARSAHQEQSAARAELESAVVVRPQAPAAPAREIHLRLGDLRADGVSLQVVDRKGRIEVAVRTPDRELAGSLRESLPTLVRRMEGVGYRVEAWAPPEFAARLAGQPPEGRPGGTAELGDPPGEGRQGGGAPGEQREREDADRRAWFEQTVQAGEERKESETWAAWLRR